MGNHIEVTELPRFLWPRIITGSVVDKMFIEGNVSKDDYRAYYTDPTRNFIPNFIQTKYSDLQLDLRDREWRESIVRDKDEKIKNLELAKQLSLL